MRFCVWLSCQDVGCLPACVPMKAVLRHASGDGRRTWSTRSVMFCLGSPDHAIDVCMSLGVSTRDALELGHTGRSMAAVWIHHLVSIWGGIGIGVH